MKREDFLLRQVIYICLSCPESVRILGKTFTGLQSKPTALLMTWVFWFQRQIKIKCIVVLHYFHLIKANFSADNIKNMLISISVYMQMSDHGTRKRMAPSIEPPTGQQDIRVFIHLLLSYKSAS